MISASTLNNLFPAINIDLPKKVKIFLIRIRDEFVPEPANRSLGKASRIRT
jgi:hypothetical protein